MNRKSPGMRPSSRNNHRSSWREKLRNATGAVIVLNRYFGPKDHATLRTKTIADAREALGETPDDAMFPTLECSKPETPDQSEPTDVCTTAGIFRLVLEDSRLDHRDGYSDETFMTEIQRNIDELLGDPSLLAKLIGQP